MASTSSIQRFSPRLPPSKSAKVQVERLHFSDTDTLFAGDHLTNPGHARQTTFDTQLPKLIRKRDTSSLLDKGRNPCFVILTGPLSLRKRHNGGSSVSKYHKPSPYRLRVEQRNGSMTYEQLRAYVEKVFKRVNKDFDFTSEPTDRTHQPPPTSPPPNTYNWWAIVYQKGHAPKFAKLVRRISAGDKRFKAEAHRAPMGPP